MTAEVGLVRTKVGRTAEQTTYAAAKFAANIAEVSLVVVAIVLDAAMLSLVAAKIILSTPKVSLAHAKVVLVAVRVSGHFLG